MINIILVVLELVVLIACIYFGYQWSENPAGNYEPYLFLGGLFFVALEIFRRYEIRLIKREGKELTPGELIKHSEELRQQVTEEIYKKRGQVLQYHILVAKIKPHNRRVKRGSEKGLRARLKIYLPQLSLQQYPDPYELNLWQH